jgi:DNA repair protein RadC
MINSEVELMSETKKKKNPHSGHRHRMRERFIQDGCLDNFRYHEILEMILYYAYPRVDTNAKAHELLDIYGSFHNLLNASPEDLMKRADISETAAVLISMLPHISRRYMGSAYEHGQSFMNINDVAKFMRSRLIGLPYENFYMLFLDKKFRYIKDIKISEGDSNKTLIYPTKVVEQALLYKATFAIMGHNHPMGTNEPSKSDKDSTQMLEKYLSNVDVKIIDHIIICGEDLYYSFNKGRCYKI